MKNKLIHRADPRRQRRRGFTLTEIAIVLGIIGLILGAIWVAAAAVYNNLRISHANTEVLQIAQAVRTLYANSANTTGLTVATLIAAQAVPSDMVSAGALVDPFPGGATTIIPTTDGNGFEIQMSNVPPGACIDLLMAVGGASRDPGLFTATANAGAAPAAVATGNPITAVATPALANLAAAGGFGGCNTISGATPAIGTVTFGFGLKT